MRVENNSFLCAKLLLRQIVSNLKSILDLQHYTGNIFMLWGLVWVLVICEISTDLFDWLMTFLHQLTCLQGTPSCGQEAKFNPLKGLLNSLSTPQLTHQGQIGNEKLK